jgi:hypothetical protein
MFITAFTSARHLSLSWPSSIWSIPPTSHFLKIDLDIILQSTPRSPKCSLSLRFPHQNPCIRLSFPSYVPHAPPVLFFSILSPEQYWVRSADLAASHYVNRLGCEDDRFHLVPASEWVGGESSWNVMAHSDAREGKWRGNRRMEWVACTLHTISEHGVSSITTADAHNSVASTRLNWRPPPADLNGLVRFAERRNLVSARVITFQTQSVDQTLLYFTSCAQRKQWDRFSV